MLAVEDDEKTQIAVKNLLEKKNIRITLASQGNVALNELVDTKIDCVIVDLQLPDMTGEEVYSIALLFHGTPCRQTTLYHALAGEARCRC